MIPVASRFNGWITKTPKKMRAVIQRVTNASVKVDGRITGQIDKGLLVLVGVEDSDTDEDI